MLPWSVMPSAGWPSATALATSSSRRAAPSSIENSVWTWRWVNESPTSRPPAGLRRLTGHTGPPNHNGVIRVEPTRPHLLLPSLGGGPLPCRLICWWSLRAECQRVHDCDSVDPRREHAVGQRRRNVRRSGRHQMPTAEHRRRIRGRCRGGPLEHHGAATGAAGAACAPGRQLAHLLELLAGGQLLGEQGGLDAVEQALEPADQLGLGDRAARPRTAPRRRRTAGPAMRSSSCRSGDSAWLSSIDRPLVDLGEALAAAPRRAAPRTSSSSCLTIEPMRITLAGSVTVSVRHLVASVALRLGVDDLGCSTTAAASGASSMFRACSS